LPEGIIIKFGTPLLVINVCIKAVAPAAMFVVMVCSAAPLAVGDICL